MYIKLSILILLFNFFTDGTKEANIITPTDSVGSVGDEIDELAGLTLEEQQKQRAEWSTVRFLDP